MARIMLPPGRAPWRIRIQNDKDKRSAGRGTTTGTTQTNKQQWGKINAGGCRNEDKLLISAIPSSCPLFIRLAVLGSFHGLDASVSASSHSSRFHPIPSWHILPHLLLLLASDCALSGRLAFALAPSSWQLLSACLHVDINADGDVDADVHADVDVDADANWQANRRQQQRPVQNPLCFLLEGVTPTAPPDVPPRNPTMSRMQNGRLTVNNPNDADFEPSCLVRTPSGNVYIPSGNLSE
ncbi:GD12069 [Drosophila simulans]|uniref:GD12069 n=1 Tax=Drosophila simulans TaxID=7240 RepID=B4QKS2_DROSI|nr:GD12069 [Drosophila simulans]